MWMCDGIWIEFRLSSLVVFITELAVGDSQRTRRADKHELGEEIWHTQMSVSCKAQTGLLATYNINGKCMVLREMKASKVGL